MTRLLAFLRTLPIAIYLYAGGAVALAGGYALWAHHVAADAVAEAELAGLEARRDTLEKQLVGERGVVHIDTVRLSRLATRWDTVKAGADTLWLRDTVRVPVEVVRDLVHAADTTIQACRLTVSDCTRLAASEKARGDVLAGEVKLLKAGQPSVAGNVLRGILWAGAGYLAGRVVK